MCHAVLDEGGEGRDGRADVGLAVLGDRTTFQLEEVAVWGDDAPGEGAADVVAGGELKVFLGSTESGTSMRGPPSFWWRVERETTVKVKPDPSLAIAVAILWAATPSCSSGVPWRAGAARAIGRGAPSLEPRTVRRTRAVASQTLVAIRPRTTVPPLPRPWRGAHPASPGRYLG
jgi:hypothetical protein